MDRDLRNEYMEFSSQTNERIDDFDARIKILEGRADSHSRRIVRLEYDDSDMLKRIVALEAWTGMAKEHIESLERQVARLQAERAIEEVDGEGESVMETIERYHLQHRSEAQS